MISNVFLILTMSTVFMSVLNPVKMSMVLIVNSMLMFFLVSYLIGSSWFPLIFLLIFMGGIIMMFMILSSILPNSKTMKFNYSLILFLILSTFLMSTKYSSLNTDLINSSKWFMQSNQNILFSVVMILIYFFSFMTLITKEKIPLRSTICY